MRRQRVVFWGKTHSETGMTEDGRWKGGRRGQRQKETKVEAGPPGLYPGGDHRGTGDIGHIGGLYDSGDVGGLWKTLEGKLILQKPEKFIRRCRVH